jgi:hypothetical protein
VRDVEAAFAALQAQRGRVDTLLSQIAELGRLKQRVDAFGRPGHVVHANERGPGLPHPDLEKKLDELALAQRQYELLLAEYGEAARERDAQAANTLAQSNNATAEASTKASKRVVMLTFVLAISTVVQTLVILSGRP